MTPGEIRRLYFIIRTFLSYGLDELIPRMRITLPLRLWRRTLFWMPNRHQDKLLGERLRLALQELGPVWIKFGQMLSTRRDLFPPTIADQLAMLQDKVAPFDGKLAKQQIEKAMGDIPIETWFDDFDIQPLASASIAQVHTARLKENGKEVVIKVIRPDILPIIRADMKLIYRLARWVPRLLPDGRRLRPMEVVREYEKTLIDELNLLRESANAIQLRRNFENSPMLYVPEVYSDYCSQDMMVMERIYGIPVSDVATLEKQGTNMKLLAERGVQVFFTQVFRDSFFHADMHPGNIFVSTVRPWSPQYIAIDCGIVGSLTDEDQDYLARNLIAFFKRDYRRVAQLHIDSGWVPAHTKVNEFEAAIRTVCEPIFEKPLKDISFGQVLMRLFQTARRFNMEVQPQLVLLQKTLLNIEGLGRQLYPDLDLWSTAKPFLERWMRDRMSPKAVIGNLYSQAEQLPHLAGMTRDLLERLSQPHLHDPQLPERRRAGDNWALRLLGAGLLGGGATLAAGAVSLSAPAAWPAWLMLAAGLYLIVRR